MMGVLLRRIVWLTLGVLLFIFSSHAQEKPKLVVGLIVDPINPDFLEYAKPLLTEDGLAKLLKEGLSFSNATTGQSFSERPTSITNMYTGTHASIHGIIGHSWYDRLSKQEITCTEDYQTITFNSFGHRAKHSAKHLLVTTLGDQIKLKSKGKVVSISLEPDGAILGSGHLSDGTYWFDSYNGQWTSNRAFIASLPQWVHDFNNSNLPDQILTKEWDLLSGVPYSIASDDGNPFEIGLYGDNITFPYKLRKMKRNSTEGEFEVLRHLPFGNTLTTDFAIAALHNEQLGNDEHTDLLNIVFTGFNKVFENYGYESQEALDALLRLDMEIQHLLFVLEESIGKDNVLLFFTGTHGFSWNVDQAMDKKLPAGRFRGRNAIALLNSYLSALYGENYWVESYINQQIYLDQTLIDQNNIPIKEIQEKAARFLTQFQGVASALTADQINSNMVLSDNSSVHMKSFYFNRSGDLLIVLRPGWIQDGNFVSDHLSPYPYDQSIPLVFWGGTIPASEQRISTTHTDICPTLCDFLGIPTPNASSGKSLRPWFN